MGVKQLPEDAGPPVMRVTPDTCLTAWAKAPDTVGQRPTVCTEPCLDYWPFCEGILQCPLGLGKFVPQREWPEHIPSVRIY